MDWGIHLAGDGRKPRLPVAFRGVSDLFDSLPDHLGLMIAERDGFVEFFVRLIESVNGGIRECQV